MKSFAKWRRFEHSSINEAAVLLKAAGCVRFADVDTVLMNLMIVVERSDYPRVVYYEPSPARVGRAKG